MEANGIIAKVTQPKEQVSSMVTGKNTEALIICFDPQDAKRAIIRHHHPLKTLNEVE